jgi:protein Tex
MNVSQEFFQQIAAELKIQLHQVARVVTLLDAGGTVPFIARYRKEATGTLDEVAITHIRDRMAQLAELNQRKTTILNSLTERALLTDALKEQIDKAETLTTLEDIYLPYRPKRRTRAMIAREKGLQPLAERLLAQDERTDPLAEAAAFINADAGVEDVEQALAGARDIIAEQVTEDKTARERIRALYFTQGTFPQPAHQGQGGRGRQVRKLF